MSDLRTLFNSDTTSKNEKSLKKGQWHGKHVYVITSSCYKWGHLKFGKIFFECIAALLLKNSYSWFTLRVGAEEVNYPIDIQMITHGACMRLGEYAWSIEFRLLLNTARNSLLRGYITDKEASIRVMAKLQSQSTINHLNRNWFMLPLCLRVVLRVLRV